MHDHGLFFCVRMKAVKGVTMSYTFHINTDPELMDEFVIGSDQNTLFQCSKWAEIKNNWDHCFYSVKEGEQIVATAMALYRSMPLGKTLMYIPRGPVMDYNNRELVQFTLEHLKEEGKKHKAIAMRFDPSVLSRKYPYRNRNDENPYMNQSVIDTLTSYGAKHRGFTVAIEESTQPRFNAAMHVTKDYMDHLEHKTVKCIRAAQHKGIEVVEGPEYIHAFATAMHFTEVRKQVALRNEDYFRHMMDVYGDHAICMVAGLNFPKQIEKLEQVIAENEEKLNSGTLKKKEKAAISQALTNDRRELAKLKEDYAREGKDEVLTCGILAVYNEKLMELFYMGNNPDYMRMYSSYLLYKLCLDRCVELGIEHCSFGGIEGTLDDGLTLFKSNWIMDVEEYIGEFNLVLDPLMYTAFDRVYPFVLKTAAKLKGRK